MTRATLQQKIEAITQDLLVDPCEPAQIEVTNKLLSLFIEFGEELIGEDESSRTWGRFFKGSGFDKSNSKHSLDVKCAYTNGYNFAKEELRQKLAALKGEK